MLVIALFDIHKNAIVKSDFNYYYHSVPNYL